MHQAQPIKFDRGRKCAMDRKNLQDAETDPKLCQCAGYTLTHVLGAMLMAMSLLGEWIFLQSDVTASPTRDSLAAV